MIFVPNPCCDMKQYVSAQKQMKAIMASRPAVTRNVFFDEKMDFFGAVATRVLRNFAIPSPIATMLPASMPRTSSPAVGVPGKSWSEWNIPCLVTSVM